MEVHWEAVKACQSCALEASFLSRLHSQAAFNIHSFFPPLSDVSARYLGSLRLWRCDLATAKSVKYGGGRRVQVPISQFGLSHALYVLDRHRDVSKDSFCGISYLVLIFKQKKKVRLFLFSFFFFQAFSFPFLSVQAGPQWRPLASSIHPKTSAHLQKTAIFRPLFTAFH